MLLTIAVPTFNRASDLSLLLASIQQETAGLEPGCVEVLVISNASTDDTDSVAASYASAIPGFRYLRNDSNVGMQANFVRALREAAGRYTWMIGDDEIIEPGGIRTVLEAIRQYSVPLLVFNYSSEPAPSGERFLTQVNNQPLSSGIQPLSAFVQEKGWLWSLGNLGMVVVETDYLRAVDPTPHMSSCFVQAGWYFEALHSQSMAFVNEAVFRTRIKSQTENKERWATDGTADSFHFVVNSIERFVSLGIIAPRVPVMFLNACSCNRMPIWNYFLQPAIKRLSMGNFQVDEREWNTMQALVERVEEEALRESMHAYLGVLRRAIVATRASHENAIWLVNRYHPNLHLGVV